MAAFGRAILHARPCEIAPMPITKDFLSKLFRFAVAGGTATLLYLALSFIVNALTAWPFMLIHVLSFALAIPCSYLLQKIFTFRHKGAHKQALWRFLVTVFTTFGVSTFAAHYAVGVLGAAHWIGFVTVAIIVPLISFICMQFWVFVERKS